MSLLVSVFVPTQSMIFATESPSVIPDFSYRSFASCTELESTLKQILPTTYNQPRFYAFDTSSRAESNWAATPTASKLDTTPRSDTNVQVRWIDEADTVKTDGKYIYSYQEGQKSIVILDAKTLNKIKSLPIATNYSGIRFYIAQNKLILTASKYVNLQNGSTYWYNTQQKSVVSVYDIRVPAKVTLIRNIEVDGYLSDTRLWDTGIMTAIVSTTYWMPPVYRTFFDEKNTSIARPMFDYSSKNLIPHISDTLYTANKPTSINRQLGDCATLGSVLPSNKTIKNFNINPTLTSILRFDISVAQSPISTQMLLSDAGQIHVTRDSVYLTSNMWSPKSTWSICPPNARCAAKLIWNPGSSSTLVHRFAITNTNIRYSYSNIIPGYPLNQYSMDEDTQGNLRIVTNQSNWTDSNNNSTTRLSVLSPSGTIIGKITDIAPGETFQSSRFIGDRLYLVTFEQIDPLFVISLTDSKNPKILGELKIPGYSTYLHPYDSGRLIGIGYDTRVNQWGGTQNGWVKIDLYDVSDVKNPKQEATLTLGDAGSSSDALWDPKQFVYYKEKNLLLLPMTLMTSANDKENSYLSKAAFQWLVGISLSPWSISEKFRISHIQSSSSIVDMWKKDCENQIKMNKQYPQYVPNYCKVWGTVDMYFANNFWNYSGDFINRVLYVGESLYTIGASRIQIQSFTAPTTPIASQKFRISTYNLMIAIDAMPTFAK